MLLSRLVRCPRLVGAGSLSSRSIPAPAAVPWFAATAAAAATRTATTTSATGWDCRHRHRRHHRPQQQQLESEALSQLRHLSSSPPAYARVKTAKAKGSAAFPAEEPAPPPAPFSTPPAVPAPQTRAAPLTLDERLERSQLKTLEDKPTQKYVAKVFSTTTATIGMAGMTSGLAVVTGLSTVISPWIGLAGIVPALWFYMGTDENTSPALRMGLLGSFTGLSALGVAPMIGLASSLDPTIVPLAFGGTALIMAGSAGAALLVPRASSLKFAPLLGGSAFALFGLGLFAAGQFALTGAVSPWLISVHLWGGLGLAVLFTAYDTQNIIEEYRAGSRDFLRHSFDMFINFMMIFRRMLALLMMNRD